MIEGVSSILYDMVGTSSHSRTFRLDQASHPSALFVAGRQALIADPAVFWQLYVIQESRRSLICHGFVVQGKVQDECAPHVCATEIESRPDHTNLIADN